MTTESIHSPLTTRDMARTTATSARTAPPPAFACHDCRYHTHVRANFQKHLGTLKHRRQCELARFTRGTEAHITVPSGAQCPFCPAQFASARAANHHLAKCRAKHADAAGAAIILAPPAAPAALSPGQIESLVHKTDMLLEITRELVADHKRRRLAEDRAASPPPPPPAAQHLHVQGDLHHTTVTVHHHHHHHNQKTTNLHAFLHETCRRALNVSEFLDTVEINTDDLRAMGELGYVDGLAKIIAQRLLALAVEDRPMHCTDLHRAVVHIRAPDNVWDRETPGPRPRPNLARLVDGVATRTADQLEIYKRDRPGCLHANSPFHAEYEHLCLQTYGGGGSAPLARKDSGVIRRLCEHTYLPQETLMLAAAPSPPALAAADDDPSS